VLGISYSPSPSKSYLKYLLDAKSGLSERTCESVVNVTSSQTLVVVAEVLIVTIGISKLHSPGGKKMIGHFPTTSSLLTLPSSLSISSTAKAYSVAYGGLGTIKVAKGTSEGVILNHSFLPGSSLG
jgi:hypothetical protein